jgi:hypothetical protein
VSVAFVCTCDVMPPAYSTDLTTLHGSITVASGLLNPAVRQHAGDDLQVASILEVSSAPRPLIDLGGTHLAFWTLQHTSRREQGAGPRPELHPFSDRETYRATLSCRCAGCSCSAAHEFHIWDGDLVLLCYRFAQLQMRFEFWGSTRKVAETRTLREFMAFFGETGARSLFRKYVASRTSELHDRRRFFADPSAAAELSAVLAEQTYGAFVEGRRSDALWDAFFAIKDFDFAAERGPSLRWWWRLWRASNRFGQAHARLGLRLALATLHSSCLADDLDRIVETLVRANRANTQLLLARHPLLREKIDPVSRFRSQLREAILEALADDGRLAVQAELKGRWDS